MEIIVKYPYMFTGRAICYCELESMYISKLLAPLRNADQISPLNENQHLEVLFYFTFK